MLNDAVNCTKITHSIQPEIHAKRDKASSVARMTLNRFIDIRIHCTYICYTEQISRDHYNHPPCRAYWPMVGLSMDL